MKFYKVTEIAEIFDRSPRTIRDWIETGCKTSCGFVRLEGVKIGRWWSVSDEALVLFQHRMKIQSTTRTSLKDVKER